MASVYSARFIAAAVDDEMVSYEVPAGVLWVVHTVDIVSTGPEPGLSVVGLLGGPIFALQTVADVAVSPLYSWRGRQVIYAGESVFVQTAGVEATFMISGYTLTLP
jgi:hypothetical protein